MCDLKWEIILYKYLVHGIPSAHTQCSAGEKDPYALSPHLTESSFGLILRQVWGIKYEFYKQRVYEKKGHENVEWRAITDVWGRWKTFYRRSEIQGGSKNALTETEKSRMREFLSKETFAENWGTAIITDPGELMRWNNIIILAVILFYSVL